MNQFYIKKEKKSAMFARTHHNPPDVLNFFLLTQKYILYQQKTHYIHEKVQLLI